MVTAWCNEGPEPIANLSEIQLAASLSRPRRAALHIAFSCLLNRWRPDMATNQNKSTFPIRFSMILIVSCCPLAGCRRQQPPSSGAPDSTPPALGKAAVANPIDKSPSVADVKAEIPPEEPIPQITQDELDTLEKNLLADPNYQWTVLKGEHRRTVALILAAQKNKPKRSDQWAGILQMLFAQEQFEARQLPEKERPDRYRYALGYLHDFSTSLESVVKADPKNELLKYTLESLSGSIALAGSNRGSWLLQGSWARKC